MGVDFIKNIKFWLFQKVEKRHNKIVKFEVENFKHLCQAQKMRAFYQQISICSFFAQKSRALGGWMDGWVDVGAGLRNPYSNQQTASPHSSSIERMNGRKREWIQIWEEHLLKYNSENGTLLKWNNLHMEIDTH